MIVRIVNNDIEELNPGYIVVDGTVYTNPLRNPSIDIKSMGFKTLIIDAVPPFDNETQCVERYYYEDSEAVHRGWRVRNLTQEEIDQRNMM